MRRLVVRKLAVILVDLDAAGMYYQSLEHQSRQAMHLWSA
jgi:hypothetical protein